MTGMIAPDRRPGSRSTPETSTSTSTTAPRSTVYAAPVEPGESPTLEIGNGTLEEAYGVAVSKFPATEGQVYVADAADHTIKVYDPAVSLTDPVRTIDGAGTAAGRFVSLVDTSLALDQSNGHLFVVDNTQPGFEHPHRRGQRVQRRRRLSAANSNTRSSRRTDRHHRQRILTPANGESTSPPATARAR